MFEKMRRKAGYISVEAIIIVGILLALGVVIMLKMFNKGTELTNEAFSTLDGANVILREMNSN